MLLIRGQQARVFFFTLERGNEKGRVDKELCTEAEMVKRSVRWVHEDALRRE